MKRLSSLLFLGICFLLTACLDDVEAPRNAPDMPTIKSSDLTRVAVTLTGTYPTGADVTEYGFQWSQDGFETYKTEKNPQMTGDGSFTWTTTSLEASTSYLFRSYITNGISTRYSTNCPVNTPSTSNATLTNVTIQNGYVTASIVDPGGRNITEFGFLCGETSNKTELKRSKRQLAESTTGTTFTKALGSFNPPLEPGGTYYFLAYAEDETDAFGYSPSPQEHVVVAIRLDKSAIEFNVGDSQTLTARFLPEGTPGQSLTWASSNAEIATVTQEGVVTAIALGDCVVTASSGGLSDSCMVTVNGVPVTSVEFNESAREVYVSENFTLTANVFPTEATNKTLTWSSSDETVATVTQDGAIVPKAPGTATISAIAASGVQASFDCIVVSEPPVFPDENFRKYVYENFDTNGDAYLSREEALRVTNINVCTDDIESLSGIETFSNLEYLYSNGTGGWWGGKIGTDANHGSNGKLKFLDLSKNLKLRVLSCHCNQLTTLDLSRNEDLYYINLDNNFISSWTISPRVHLQYLNCSLNDLGVIDVSGYTELTRLECLGCGLKSLDVSNNTKLEYLNCEHNDISSLDLSNNTNLIFLGVSSNKQIKTLDISKNTRLNTIHVVNTQISSLNFTNNTELSYIECQYNQLVSLDISSNINLISLSCSDNQLTTLDWTNNIKLKRLDCSNNPLLVFDVSCLVDLEELGCAKLSLDRLDVSNNKKLTNIACDYNNLKSLDISNNTKLTRLTCNGNQLKGIDVSILPELKTFWCGENMLTSLDLTHNQKLEEVLCNDNELNNVALSYCPALTRLNCSRNQLTTLDVSGCQSLSSLFCGANPSLSEVWLKSGQTISTLWYDASVTTIKYKE